MNSMNVALRVIAAAKHLPVIQPAIACGQWKAAFSFSPSHVTSANGHEYCRHYSEHFNGWKGFFKWGLCSVISVGSGIYLFTKKQQTHCYQLEKQSKFSVSALLKFSIACMIFSTPRNLLTVSELDQLHHFSSITIIITLSNYNYSVLKISNYNYFQICNWSRVEITISFKNMKIQWKPLNTAPVYRASHLFEQFRLNKKTILFFL